MKRKTKVITVTQYCKAMSYKSNTYVLRLLKENRLTLLKGVISSQKLDGKTAAYLLTVDVNELPQPEK